MLDVRPTAYVCPIAEQEIGPLTPIVTVQNFADEDARINALFRIYRETLGILEYSSVSATVDLAHGQTTSLAALTPFDPGAPADHDFFILCDLSVLSIPTGQVKYVPLGQYFFDIKPAPMGPPPETHHTTHEAGGMDPIDVTGMPGVLAEPQTPETHLHESIPILGVYVTTNHADPALALGFGTWAEIVMVPPISILYFYERTA